MTLALTLLTLVFNRSLSGNYLGFFGFYTFFGRFSEFLMGSFTFVIFQSVPRAPRFSTTIGAIGILASPAILSYFWGGKGSFGVLTYQGMLFNNLVLPLFISCFIIGLITEKTNFQTVLSSNFFQLLGKASFCFYLLHEGVVADFVLNAIANPYLTIVILYLVSAIVWFFYEEKVRGMIMNSSLVKTKN